MSLNGRQALWGATITIFIIEICLTIELFQTIDVNLLIKHSLVLDIFLSIIEICLSIIYHHELNINKSINRKIAIIITAKFNRIMLKEIFADRWFKHDILVERGLIGSLYTMYIKYSISRVYQQSQKSESLAKRLILIPLHWAPVKRLICHSNEATPWNSWNPNTKSQTAYRFFNDLTRTKKAKQRIYLYISQYLID